MVYTVKYYTLKKLIIFLCLSLSSLTIEYKCRNFNKFYLGYQPNLTPVTAADQMLGNDAWKTTFLFVTALLNSAEVPWGLGGGQTEGNIFSFGNNGSEYSVGYERRAAAFRTKICFCRSATLPNA